MRLRPVWLIAALLSAPPSAAVTRIGRSIPFEGLSQTSFQTGPFTGAVVLDAAKQVVPDAPISASDSGFAYAPEPDGPAAAGGALFALAALARARAPNRSSARPGRLARPS